MCAETHTYMASNSQALDDALKLNGLALEGMVSAVASNGSHHVGPPVPRYGVGWRKRGGNRKTQRKIHTYVWVIFKLPCC